MSFTRNRIRPRTVLLLAAALAALVMPSVAAAAPGVAGHPVPSTANASLMVSDSAGAGAPTPNSVVRWNAIAGDAALAACLAPTDNPLHESRMYTMMHLAIHDALNAIKPQSRPYAFRGHAPHASPEAAVAAAARTVLVNALAELTPPFSACSAAAQAGVEADYTAALAAIPDSKAKMDGITLGRKSAYAILRLRATDGSDTPHIVTDFPLGKGPGDYRITPGSTFVFTPGWGSVDPFVKHSNQVRIDPPYDLHSKAYADDLNEVKRLGGNGTTTPSARTAEETEIARFWVESSPLLWNRIARQLATTKHLDLWQSARLFALLDMALNDGYVAAFYDKYTVLFWRPVTAIRLAATDGNPATTGDPTWLPLVVTPPIPDHDSGHSVESGAASAVLQGFFGTDHMRFSTCSYTLPAGSRCTDTTPVLRHFTSFSQASAENARSRVLVGFHFTHATTVGVRHGKRIGDLTVRNYLQTWHGRS